MNELPEHLKETGVPIRRESLHGTARLQITFFRVGDRRFTASTPSGHLLVTGIPIEELRERLGGNEGYVVGPTGQRHHVLIPPQLPDGEGIMASLEYTVIPKSMGRERSKLAE